MDNFAVSRTIKFVSLDTHPANNALVITYDVLASATDPTTGHELSKASKRHQQLVKISLLDELDAKNQSQTNNRFAIDLNGLSNEIIRKCPLLSSDHGSSRKRPGQNIEDIKLHLLYLINRRHTQNHAPDSRPDDHPKIDRPSSSSRFGPSFATKKRPASSLSKRSPSTLDSEAGIYSSEYRDVYTWLLEKEKPIDITAKRKLFNHLVEHLQEVRLNANIQGEPTIKLIDSYLDSLYGGSNERFESLHNLQQLYLDDGKLLELAEKRLLVCALVRTLADTNHQSSQETDTNQCELVLCCLIRLTNFRDIYQQAFRERNNIAGVDLVSAHLGSLAAFVGRLLQDSKKSATICLDSQFYLAAGHLLLVGNLIQLELDQILTVNLSSNLFSSLNGILHLLTNQLSQDLRTMSKPDKIERSIFLLAQLFHITNLLTSTREFINYIKGPKAKNKEQEKGKQSQTDTNSFLDCMVKLINRLQMSRPGSGNSAFPEQPTVKDRTTLNDFYELELLAFKTISYLMRDRIIKLKLIKKNILKSVLRNLVSLLASRNNLTSFNKSYVLLVPLDCLYKLTCEHPVLNELCKSKLILRCLFEYLLNSSLTLHQNLGSDRQLNKPVSNNLAPVTEIKLDPNCSDHYLLCIWCNLTSHIDRLTIMNSDTNLVKIQHEYIDSVCNLTSLFSKKGPSDDEFRLIVYLHLKLTANMSRPTANCSTSATVYGQMVEKLATAAMLMTDRLEILSPLAVECLWTISNLLLRGKDNPDEDAPMNGNMKPNILLINLMERLFTFSQTNFESETEDDLLLVSCLYTAILADRYEICGNLFADNGKSYSKIIRATNFLLTSKSSDKTILYGSLFTFMRLTNHRECSLELATQLAGHDRLTELIPRITSYMLHHEEDVANLACRLVDRLVQMVAITNTGGDRYQRVITSRFVAYNAKWMQAIQASRNELMTPPDEDPERDNWLDDDRELLEDAAELEGSGLIGSRSSSYRDKSDLLVAKGDTEFCGQFEDDYEDNGLDYDDNDDLTSTLSSVDAPDLTVVDQNSMIKHLISRQKFRSQWAKQQQ